MNRELLSGNMISVCWHYAVLGVAFHLILSDQILFNILGSAHILIKHKIVFQLVYYCVGSCTNCLGAIPNLARTGEFRSPSFADMASLRCWPHSALSRKLQPRAKITASCMAGLLSSRRQLKNTSSSPPCIRNWCRVMVMTINYYSVSNLFHLNIF